MSHTLQINISLIYNVHWTFKLLTWLSNLSCGIYNSVQSCGFQTVVYLTSVVD